MIQLKFATWLGKKTYVDIIVFLTEKVIQSYKLQSYLKKKIKFLPKRSGERYASALTNMNLSNRVYKYFGKKKLKDYVEQFIINNQ